MNLQMLLFAVVAMCAYIKCSPIQSLESDLSEMQTNTTGEYCKPPRKSKWKTYFDDEKHAFIHYHLSTTNANKQGKDLDLDLEVNFLLCLISTQSL